MSEILHHTAFGQLGNVAYTKETYANLPLLAAAARQAEPGVPT